MAQYANACNLFASSPEEIAHKLDVLRGHCDAVGSDEAEIGKTILYVAPTLAGGDRDAFLADMADYAGLGISEVVVMPPTGRADAWIEQVRSGGAKAGRGSDPGTVLIRWRPSPVSGMITITPIWPR